MFSKIIFKQTLKSNYKLWLIFTAITCILSSTIISIFNPQMISSMMEAFKDSPMASFMGDDLENMNSLLGMLGNNFYSMQGTILPLIFIIITANSLVASQVDQGSMAYILSTPVKRTKVIATQAIYLVSSIFFMIASLTISGLLMVQIMHGGIVGETYTDDVKELAKLEDMEPEKLANNLHYILEDISVLKKGAEIRGIDEDIYSEYISLKIINNSFHAAAGSLNVDVEDVKDDLTLIKNNDKALNEASKVMNMTKAEYDSYLETMIMQKGNTEQMEMIQNNMITGLSAVSEKLDIDITKLSEDMSIFKTNENALNIAVEASGIDELTFISLVNQQLATEELVIDEGLNFNVKDYLMLNLGLFLLMLAISSVSFASSCIFNLTKFSLTFGAGLPIAFFVFQIMSQLSTDLEMFKYLTLNSLFDINAIIAGGDYLINFVTLALISITLYSFSIYYFNKKDLPL